NTASKAEFTQLMAETLSLTKGKMLIADEAHGIGAPTFRKALLEDFRARLGLSATPTRWFDSEGTAILENYFGGVVYEFGLHQALNWVSPTTGEGPLSQYMYFPNFVNLTEHEMEEYLDLT